MGESGPEEEPEKPVSRALRGCLGFSLTVGELLLLLACICAFRNLSLGTLTCQSYSRARQLQLNRAKTSRLMF